MDNRDYLERGFSYQRLLTGEDTSPDDVAREFAKHDTRQRANTLNEFDAEMADDNSLSLRRRAEMLVLRRKLGDVHGALQKAGR